MGNFAAAVIEILMLPKNVAEVASLLAPGLWVLDSK